MNFLWIFGLVFIVFDASAAPTDKQPCENCDVDTLERSIDVFMKRLHSAKAHEIVSEDRVEQIINSAAAAKSAAKNKNIEKLAENIDSMVEQKKAEDRGITEDIQKIAETVDSTIKQIPPNDRRFLDDAFNQVKEAYDNGGFGSALLKSGEIFWEKSKQFFEPLTKSIIVPKSEKETTNKIF